MRLTIPAVDIQYLDVLNEGEVVYMITWTFGDDREVTHLDVHAGTPRLDGWANIHPVDINVGDTVTVWRSPHDVVRAAR